jgi:hypothetical protein
MKTLISCALTIWCLVLLSCEDTNVNPGAGFIKATINGIETIYNTPPPGEDYYNYIRPGAINIRFNKDNIGSQYWSIDIIYGNTALDLNNLQLPYTIKGPNPDFSGKSPEAHTLIIDPDGAPYGKQIAAGSSFDHEFTLTITSVLSRQ